jgi:hypothetical protein
MRFFGYTLLSVAVLGPWGCAGELNGGVLDEVETFATTVANKDVGQACQETKDRCQTVNKGCKAYNLFCSGAETSAPGSLGGSLADGGMTKPSGDGCNKKKPGSGSGGYGSDGGYGDKSGDSGAGGFDKSAVCKKLLYVCKSGKPWSKKACAVYHKACTGLTPQAPQKGDGGWPMKEAGANPSLPTG